MSRDKLKKRQYDIVYRKANTHKVKAWGTKYNTSINGRYTFFKRAVLRRGEVLGISFEQYSSLIGGGLCHYCTNKLPSTGYGLDRMDNSKGYLLSNVVACCKKCNYMKGDYLSYSEMIEVVSLIKNLRGQI